MLGILKDIGVAAGRLLGRQIQAARLRHERRRFDRLYGPIQLKAVPAPIGADGQSDRLARIVSDYCQRGQSITETHEAARVKLDAAEYSFTSLLKELSSVMGDAPSDWTPARATAQRDPTSGDGYGIQAVAA